MKSNRIKVIAFFLTGALLCGSLVGCGSEGTVDKKEQVSANSSKDGKEEAEEVKKSAQKEQKEETTSKDNAETKGKTQSSKGNKETTSDKKNTNTTKHQVPISNKKVSFNKDKLYNMMVSIYKEPNYIKEPTKNEFSHEIRGQIPEKVKKVFDWYLNVLDTGKDADITITAEEYKLFIETWPNVLNFTSNVNYRENRDGTISLQVTKQMINEGLECCYNDYCKKVQEANAPAKQQYESYIAKTKQACDMIEKAANAANIKGKDEVTAINSIIDYICKNCTYWNEAVGMPADQHKGEWISDCLGDHHAVCNGYAKTFYAMCYYAGIDVTYYWGYTNNGGAHAWDSVKIGGKDYYFDITWQDAIIESGSSKDTYMWAGNTEFSKEHVKKGTDIAFW